MKDYYQKNFQDYYNRTVSVDPSKFLVPFVNSLEPGSSVLDIGCGSGRDLLWLKNKGFKVTGFERSSGLADLARKYVDCNVIQGDFETYDFSQISYDNILASGSLVHISHEQLSDILKNIKQALSQNGIFYVSLKQALKQGENTKTDRFKRTFYLWHDKELRQLFSSLNFEVIHFSNTKSVLNSKDPWLGYVLKRIHD